MSNSPTVPPEASSQSAGFYPVNFSIIQRRIIIHQISDPELETIAALGNSLHLTLFGVCAGGFVTLLVTITTVSIPGPRAFAAFVSCTVLTALATVFFGWRGIAAFWASRKKLAEIRAGSPSAHAQ